MGWSFGRRMLSQQCHVGKRE